MEGNNRNHSKDVKLVQESYIKSLIQQIKILELETEFLKNQKLDNGNTIEGFQQFQQVNEALKRKDKVAEKENEESQTKMKNELQAANTKIENVKLEKQKLAERIKSLEMSREEEKAKLLDQISRLTGRVEHLEKEAEVSSDWSIFFILSSDWSII